MTTVGTGKYKYKLIPDWAKLPDGETFGTVSTVATDSQDRVYVLQRKDPPILIFDRLGNYLSSWGNGAFASPHGMSISDDIVYATDRDDSVCLKFTLEGRPLQIFGRRGVHSDTGCERPATLVPRAAGPFNYPTEMVCSPSGDIFVSDGYRNSRVHRFSSEGRLIASWGEPGKTGPNQFHLPHSIFVDPDGQVYVCDRENCRIQIFTPEGRYVTMWNVGHRPEDIAVDPDGVLYVNTGGHPPQFRQSANHEAGSPPQVIALNSAGVELARWDHRLSTHGLWVDSRGDIYLAISGIVEGGYPTVDKYVRQ